MRMYITFILWILPVIYETIELFYYAKKDPIRERGAGTHLMGEVTHLGNRHSS